MTAEYKRALIEQGRAQRAACVEARKTLRAGLSPANLAPQALQRAGLGVLAAWLGGGAAARVGALLPLALRLWPLVARGKRLRLAAVAAAAAGLVVYLRRKQG